MSGVLDELRADAKEPIESDPPAEKPAADETRHAKANVVNPPSGVIEQARSAQLKPPKPTLPPAKVAIAGPLSYGEAAPEVREPAEPREALVSRSEISDAPPSAPTAASVVRPPMAVLPQVISPPPLTLPPVPDLRPQLEAVRDALVRNQQLTMDTLRSMKLVLDAHATELSELKQQIRGQQSVVSNLRRF